MRHRTITAALSVFVLVAAAAPVAAEEEEPGGTATTRMLGIELEIDEVDVADLLTVDGVDLEALDLSTSATTVEAPAAEVDVLPLRVGEQELGRTTVRAEDGEDDSAETAALTELAAEIGAIELRATTTDDSAEAVFGAAQEVAGQLELLGDAVVGVRGLVGESRVDADEAAGTVGLRVDGVGLDLGDLLGADLLGALPLDVLLDLADLLGAEVDELATAALRAAQDDVEDAAAELSDLAAELADDVDALGDELDAVAADIAALEDAIDELESDLATLAGDPSVDTVVDLIAAHDDCGVTLDPLDLDGTIGELEACLEDELDDLNDELDGLRAQLADAAGDVAATLSDIQDALGDLADALDDLLDALLDMIDDALAVLDDLVDELAGAELLGLGEIAVEVEAQADADDAAAALTCAVGGEDVDCIEGSAELTAVVDDAITTVAGVVDILGVADDEVVLEVFGEAATSTETGATNTADSRLEILRLQIPAITIDVDVDDGLADITDVVRDALDELRGELEDGDARDDIDEVDGILGTALGSSVDDAVGTIDDLEEPADGVLADIDDALDELSDLLAGALPDVTVATPGLRLLIDPGATAAFTPDDAVPDPAPADEPDDEAGDDEPPLPVTGGGLTLLALLAIAGAAALLRGRAGAVS